MKNKIIKKKFNQIKICWILNSKKENKKEKLNKESNSLTKITLFLFEKKKKRYLKYFY